MPENKQTLLELSRALPERERKDLLKRIKSSVQIGTAEENQIYHADIEEEERNILIEQELQKLSFWNRLRLWFMELFRGKDRKQLFLELKLFDLRKRITQKQPDFCNFSGRIIKAPFAESVFDLYLYSVHLYRFFHGMWKDEERFIRAMNDLLDRSIPDAKRDVEGFFPILEMLDTYEKTRSKEAIKKELSKRIKVYLDNIPDEVFEDITHHILPFYYLRYLVLYPYSELFQLFGVDISSHESTEYPEFQDVPVSSVSVYLERLFFAVYSVKKISEPVVLTDDYIVVFQDDGASDSKNAASQPSSSQEEDESRTSPEYLKKSIRELIGATKEFADAVPLGEIIRYFRNDPYFRIYAYLPKLNLKDFYYAMLRVKMMNQVEKRYPDVKNMHIERELRRVFGEQRLRPFRYYREYTNSSFSQLGLPTFLHVRSLNVLFHFVRWYYRENIQQLIQVLSRGILSQNRITQNRLVAYAAGVEDLEDRIRQHDESLSPDREDGKTLQRLRFNLSKETSQQRIYRSLVSQKDQDVKTLLDRGVENLQGIAGIIDDIVNSSLQSIKNQLKQTVHYQGVQDTLANILKVRSKKIHEFLHLLEEIRNYERGKE
ncbi:MAG: DUF5312 domain-containing protein [Spirochaetales bacterium]|nr:DUF5312 domain-containing protein [Spirochaetales bacterium]